MVFLSWKTPWESNIHIVKRWSNDVPNTYACPRQLCDLIRRMPNHYFPHSEPSPKPNARCWTSGATSVIDSESAMHWFASQAIQYHDSLGHLKISYSTIAYLTHWKLQLSSLPHCPPWMPKSWVLGYKLLEPHLGCSHFSLVELACSLLPSEILVTLWPMWNSHHQKSKIAQVTI